MLSSQTRQFGDTLVERRVVSREDIEQAIEDAAHSGASLPDLITSRFEIPESDLAAAWSALHGVQYVDFAAEVVEADAVLVIPSDMARSLRAVPVKAAQGRVLVAFEHPLQGSSVESVTAHLKAAGFELIPGLAEAEGIEAALQVAYPDPTRSAVTTVKVSAATEEMNRLFDRTVELGGSDLHLAAGQVPFVRVVGDLVRMPNEPELSAARVKELIFSILSQRQIEKFEQNHELDTSHAHGHKVRFRVNVFLQRNAVGAAFRVIPYEVVPFDQLGLPASVKSFADLPRGLVLVTGPTGSGKSTTLASLVDIVNTTRKCHIVTIEDPIEFVHHSKTALINQREVGSDTNGFTTALTSAMRQDPDVILVGEMRDRETIGTAITAAETGHLVFATLHTQDAPSTVDRIIDVFPGEQQGQIRVQLASSLQGVITQQLIPTADGRGRAVAIEVMIATHPVRALIREGKIHQIHNSMIQGKRQGMIQMNDSLSDLVKRGIITPEMAVRRSNSPDELARALGVTQASV